MKIRLTPEVFARLEAIRVVVNNLEYSGFGFVNILNENGEKVFEVYDVVLLDVGSSGFTEIPAEKTLSLMERSDAGKMKVWFHRHPVGSDIPGPHNWSGTDEVTATQNPLGGIPEMVKWAIAIVRTPKTWIGRVDIFKPEGVQTAHLPVDFNSDQNIIAEAVLLKAEYEARRAKEEKAFTQTFLQEPADMAIPFGTRIGRMYRRIRNAIKYRLAVIRARGTRTRRFW